MTDIDDFAPYPDTENAVTLDGIARHEAVHAFMLMREAADRAHRMFAAGGSRVPTVMQITRYAAVAREAKARFLVTLLLRAVAEHAPEAAEEIAKDVYRAQQGVDDCTDFVWHWLRGYGIDPERVVEAQQARQEAA